ITTTAARSGTPAATTIAPSPITTRRSGSIQQTRFITITAATPGLPRTISLAPLPTPTKRAGSVALARTARARKRNRMAALGAAAALIAVGVGGLTPQRRTPIPTDTQAAAKFFLTACGDSAHNLLAVAQLAERRGWSSMITAADPENAILRVTGMWRVDEDRRSYTVTAGLGPGDHTTCQVGFEHPK